MHRISSINSIVVGMAMTLMPCLTACQSGLSTHIEEKPRTLDERCLQKAETGHCRAYLLRYAFEVEKNQCIEYVYGGCGPSAFESLVECQSTCVTR